MWQFRETTQARRVDARRADEPVHLSEQHSRVDHDAVGDHRGEVRIQDARGDQLELERVALGDDRVAGVVPALVADHEVHPVGEVVGRLALALVPPLGPDDDRGRHRPSLSVTSRRSWRWRARASSPSARPAVPPAASDSGREPSGNGGRLVRPSELQQAPPGAGQRVPRLQDRREGLPSRGGVVVALQRGEQVTLELGQDGPSRGQAGGVPHHVLDPLLDERPEELGRTGGQAHTRSPVEEPAPKADTPPEQLIELLHKRQRTCDVPLISPSERRHAEGRNDDLAVADLPRPRQQRSPRSPRRRWERRGEAGRLADRSR